MKSREKVTAFDFENAFKALSEMEIPKVESRRKNLSERFIRSNVTNALMEDYYNVSDTNDLANAQDNRKEEIAQAKLARIEKIVDLNAETPEDILPSYVGKNIIQCPQCMTLFYKDQTDIEVSEEDNSTCNVSEICQHCGNDSGYTLIGKVAAVEEPTEEENAPVEDTSLENEEPTEEVEQEAEENSDQSSEDENLNLEIEEEPAEETEEEQMVVEESLKLHENKDVVDKIEPTLDQALRKSRKNSKDLGNVLLNLPTDKHLDAERKIKEWAKNNGVNIFELNAKEIDETIFNGMLVAKDGNKTSELRSNYWDQIKENTVLLITNVFGTRARLRAHFLRLINEKSTATNDLRDKILFSIMLNPVEEEADIEPAFRAKVPFTLSDDSLNEAVDKELDNKLKAHNDYIEYLKDEIEKAEKELENAKNEFVKKSIEARLESLKADLEAALPEALKDEVQDELPAADEIEEVKESLTENLKEESAEELLQDFADSLGEELKETPEEDFEYNHESEIDFNKRADEVSAEGRLAMQNDFEDVQADHGYPADKEKTVNVEEDLETEEKLAKFEQSLEEELKGNGEIHFIYKRSKVYTQVWNRDNKSIDEIMNIAKKYGCDVEVKKYNYLQLSCNINNEENLLRAFAEINPNYSFDALKKLQESNKKNIKEDFDDVSSEEFKSMINNPVYYEEFDKEEEFNGFEDVEELDECSLNEHISNYLTNVYKNVKSFETTSCAFANNKLIVEGKINLKSGKIRSTLFEFTIKNRKLIGKNSLLNESTSYTLNYKLKNKTIITESFKCNK